MKLAKQHIDVGLFTNRREAQLAFWREVIGLPFDHMAKLGGGIHQYRFVANGSIVKVNDCRDPLPVVSQGGYVELIIARDDIDAPRPMLDPDGTAIAVAPRGSNGVVGLGVRVASNDPVAHAHFYSHVLGLEHVAGETYRCGDSLIFVQSAIRRVIGCDIRGVGLRYLTIQVPDCDQAHADILKRGGREGRPPVTMGDTARFSFLRDPDGNWIEISETASLTGRPPRS
jgi:predicted enzyme related to lactoylglutathione lyase